MVGEQVILENKMMLSVLLLGLFIVGIVGGNYYGLIDVPFLGVTALPQGGLEVQSITATRFITNDADIANANFLISAVANVESTQAIVGTIKPEETENIGWGDYKTAFPLTISVTAREEKARYRIINDKNHIIKWRMEETACALKTPACPDKPTGVDNPSDYNLQIEYRGTAFDFLKESIGSGEDCGWLKSRSWCYYQYPDFATSGHLETPEIKSSADVQMCINNVCDTQTVSSSVRSADFQINNEWAGSVTINGLLITGDSPPIASEYIPTVVGGQNWKVAKKGTHTNYDDAEDEVRNYLNVITGNPDFLGHTTTSFSNMEKLNSLISTQNDKADFLVKEDVNLYDQSDSLDTEVENNDVVVILNRVLTKELMTFKVKADALGVYLTTGEPKITDISNCEALSGEEGNVEITVKNTADASATIGVSMENCPGWEQAFSGWSNEKKITGGGEYTFDLAWDSGKISEDLKQTCEFKAFDVQKPSNFDTATVLCELTEAEGCEEGVQETIQNCIYDCTNGKLEEKECCKSPEAPKYNTERKIYECKGVGGNGGGDGDTNPELIVKLIASLIVFILIYKLMDAGIYGVIAGFIGSIAVWMLIGMITLSPYLSMMGV